MFALLLFAFMCCSANGRDDVHQLNYGTVFKKMPQLYSTSEFWTHTFVIGFQDLDNVTNFVPCNCPRYENLMEQLANLNNDSITTIQNTREAILNLLQYSNKHSNPSRSRRSLLPFIGDITKSLFGIATTSDLQNVANHVNALQKAHIALNTKFNHEAELLTSFMATTNDRFNNAIAGIQDNHNLIEQYRLKVENTFNDLRNQQSWLMSIVLSQMTHHQVIQQYYSSLFSGFITLLNGKLSPLIIPQQYLSTAISNIRDLLNIHRPEFHLVHSDPTYYYNHADFLVTKGQSNILVTVRFPVASLDQPMKLFKILSYPVPINNTSTHATMISGLPTYFAIPHKHNFQSYVTLTKDSLDLCDHDINYIHCHDNIPTTPLSNPSCPLALYSGNTSLIHELCTFHFVPNSITPTISQLNQSHFLIVNISSVTIQCMESESIVNCHFCILEVPCNCSIQSNQYQFMPRFTGCHTNDTEFTVSHPVNLIMLQKFFGESAVASITANSTFPSPLNITTKPFTFYNHEFAQMVATDNTQKLNLEKMVASAKEDQLIYSTMADPILNSGIFNENQTSLQSIISFVAIGMSVISLLGYLCLFRKYKSLAATVTMATQFKSASSASLPSFIYTDAPTQQTPIPWTTQVHTALPHYNTYILLTLSLLAFLYFIKQQIRQRQKPELMLEVSNSFTSITCRILTLPTCISFCTYHSDSKPQINGVRFGFTPKLSVNWNNFSINVSGDMHTLLPPISIPLTWIQAFHFKRILQTRHVTQIWLTHHNYCVPIDISVSPCVLNN